MKRILATFLLALPAHAIDCPPDGLPDHIVYVQVPFQDGVWFCWPTVYGAEWYEPQVRWIQGYSWRPTGWFDLDDVLDNTTWVPQAGGETVAVRYRACRWLAPDVPDCSKWSGKRVSSAIWNLDDPGWGGDGDNMLGSYDINVHREYLSVNPMIWYGVQAAFGRCYEPTTRQWLDCDPMPEPSSMIGTGSGAGPTP